MCEGSQLRRGPRKASLFRGLSGRVLFEAVGTGLDIPQLPPGLRIVGVDISADMLQRAERRRRTYPGRMQFVQADAHRLPFPDSSFDSVATACTMCSVPDPLRALREIHRVLRPGGRLLMFEHVRSHSPVFGLALDAMTLWTRWSGTYMNRDTVAAVRAAGFRLADVQSAYLDIILSIRATKESAGR